jgi:hypothetical protein
MATIGVSGPNLVLLPPITAAYPADHVLGRVADELRRQGFRRVRIVPDAVEFAQPPFFTHSRAPAVGGGVCRLAGAGDDRWVKLDLRFDHPASCSGGWLRPSSSSPFRSVPEKGRSCSPPSR